MNKREKLLTETHPSLCGKHIITCVDGTWFYANNYSEPKQKVHYSYSDYAIQKHTTDNQRIREAIETELCNMKERKEMSGEFCYYKTPKEEAIALCVRLWIKLIDSQDDILKLLKELGLGDMND